MSRRCILASAALFVALALPGCASVQPSTQTTPFWRMDAKNLAADTAVATACLARPDDELDACVHSVPPCQAGLPRQCAWRAIAAWEDVTAGLLTRLRGHVDAGELDADQKLWEASMIADVRLATSMYDGGSLEGQVAAFVRAEAQARRAVWLERLRRQLDE